MIGQYPYFTSTGLNGDVATVIRASKITRKSSKNLGIYPIAGTLNNPNSDIDYISSNNRRWTIEGTLPLVSGVGFSEGLGLIADGGTIELSLSGLNILEITGSTVYFYDEIMVNRYEISSGVGTLKTTKVKVVIQNVEIGRSTDYVSSMHEVGYILPYRISLIEDK